MKNRILASLSLPLSFAAFAGSAPQARADTAASVQQFFAAAQGEYSGNGETRQFGAAGENDTSYDIDLNVSLADDGSLAMAAQTEDENGNPASYQVTLKMSGGTLYYSDLPGQAIPVRVVAATGTALDYTFEIVGSDGQLYTFENSYSLGDGSITFHDTISLNGATIESVDFDIAN